MTDQAASTSVHLAPLVLSVFAGSLKEVDHRLACRFRSVVRQICGRIGLVAAGLESCGWQTVQGA
jgi:hypothetical protein